MTHKSQQNKPPYEPGKPPSQLNPKQGATRTVTEVTGGSISPTSDGTTDSVESILAIRDPLIRAILEETNDREKILKNLVLAHPHIRYGLFDDSSMDQFNNLGLKDLIKSDRITIVIRHIVRGEEEDARNILKAFPLLLRVRNKTAVTDYSGRCIKTLYPLWAALCAGDKDMCAMIKEIFLAYPEETGGFSEMVRQFHEVFPRGVDTHIEEQKQKTFDFSRITAAIDDAKDKPAELQDALKKVGASFTEEARCFSEMVQQFHKVLPRGLDAHIEEKEEPENQWTLTEKLNLFRENFSLKSRREIVFNPQHLLTALKIYDQKYDGWNDDQRHLFWRGVVIYAQNFLPVCDARAFIKRIFELNSSSNFGFNYPWGADAQGARQGVGTTHAVAILQNLYQEKTKSFTNLCRTNPQPTSRCVIQ